MLLPRKEVAREEVIEPITTVSIPRLRQYAGKDRCILRSGHEIESLSFGSVERATKMSRDQRFGALAVWHE